MKNIAFDFDLTLVNTRTSIIESLRRTFEQLNLISSYDIERSFDAIKALKLRGQIEYLLQQKLSGVKLENIVSCYMTNYLEFGISKTILFDGVPEMFELFSNKGFCIHIVSAKSEVNLLKSIEFVGIRPDFVIANVAGHEKSKYLVQTGCTTYVGDANLDVDVAKTADCKSIIINADKSEVKSWQNAPDFHFIDIKEFLDWLQNTANVDSI